MGRQSHPGANRSLSAALRRLLGLDVRTEDLPARVREAIERQQDAGERLTAWVQLGIVLFFAALYAIAPKTYTGNWMYPPVTLAITGFFLAVGVRLVAAHRRRAPAWLVSTLVVADLTLLLTLIWSFHIQYGQPPAFSLKAPTLLYVFIFIALRTLRFEARYVLLAGFTAAAGWLVLAAYAAFFYSPHGGVITRDYVHYLTSNSVLIGAELDKIIAILVVTIVLAVALGRARRLLVRSVIEEAAARDLSRFFAPEIADRITRAELQVLPGHGEARDAAVLNMDIRGFTQLARAMTPDELIGTLVEYQSRMVPVIQAEGGSIDKFLGDGILATFGAVAPTRSYAADALRALEAVVRESDRWNEERAAAGQPPLMIGAAVATGPVVFGAVGDDTRLEYTVIGDTANLSAKLEKHNKATDSRALTTKTALELAIQQGYQPPAALEHLPSDKILDVDSELEIVLIAR